MLIRSWRCLLALGLCMTVVAAVHGREDPNQDDSATRPSPTVAYVMAAPRACLIDAPQWAAAFPWLPSGAAENFARADGSIRVVVGTKVAFALGSETEAVWYGGAYGTIATSLEVQRRVDNSTDDDCTCTKCRPGGTDANDRSKTTAARRDAEVCPWVTVGTDGVKETRKGPSIGHADVAVGVRFQRPGTYSIRGIVRTAVEPQYTQPTDGWRDRLGIAKGSRLPDIAAEADRDVVLVKVVVVDKPEPNEEPEDGTSDDPDAVNRRPMPKDQDVQGPTEAVL